MHDIHQRRGELKSEARREEAILSLLELSENELIEGWESEVLSETPTSGSTRSDQ